MIRFAVCLFLTTAALAQHYGAPDAQASKQMDYDNGMYNRDMRIQPSSNFFYNFQHARLDQPDQVEVREENMGKYMGRPRPTTTAIPKLKKEQIPDINAVHLHRLADINTVSTMTPYVPIGPFNAHLPATMPPPPATPRWMDLSDDVFKNHAHHKPGRFAVNPMTYQPAPTLPPVQPTVEWSQPPSVPVAYDSQFSQQQPIEPQPMGYANQPQNYAPTTEDILVEDHYGQEPVRGRGRGRGQHKFNWNDVSLEQTAPPAPVTMPAPAPHVAQKRPPPSIPTLTPWSGDSFGK